MLPGWTAIGVLLWQIDKVLLAEEASRFGFAQPRQASVLAAEDIRKLLADLADVWEDSGKTVLEHLAVNDPGKLAQIAYGLLPRDVFISVEQRTPGNLDPDEWAILRRVIDLIQVNAKSAELGPVLETIENALRADHAKMIEAE